MASKLSRRGFRALSQSPCCQCSSPKTRAATSSSSTTTSFSSSASLHSFTSPLSTRAFSTSRVRSSEQSSTDSAGQRPRWSYTPPQMMAPFPHRLKNPNKSFIVNEDPAKLDRMYVSFLGPGGDILLDDEVKWLAVTHKSFDQGRRGFNVRLLYFGKQIIQLETAMALLQDPFPSRVSMQKPDPYGRTPFEHPALEGLSNLEVDLFNDILTKKRVASLATQVGLGEVTRWKPKNPANLAGSGIDLVLASSLYAIIGAIALQKGNEVASRIARDRVLRPLGIL